MVAMAPLITALGTGALSGPLRPCPWTTIVASNLRTAALKLSISRPVLTSRAAGVTPSLKVTVARLSRIGDRRTIGLTRNRFILDRRRSRGGS